ncbi:MAG TPA: AbrB family transcriptional regulator [Bacillales bacterium]|nr:AbrB family transcriptional regulator [Bacillales bacterium]
MLRTLVYLVAAGVAGWGCALLQVPAGWLIGSLIVGICYRLGIGNLRLPTLVFPFALALIGANIGLSMKMSMFAEVAAYFFPLMVSLVAVLFASWLFSLILAKFSSLDGKTALFCCVPGGASVMLALSEEYGADQRIVAAFQSARVILIVLAIPLFAGLTAHLTGAGGTAHSVAHETAKAAGGGSTLLLFLAVIGVIVLSLTLAKWIKIPAAPFLYAMLLAFLINQFLVPIGALPNTIVGIGQVLLGACIGLRFDRAALKQLKSIGWLSTSILLLFLVLTFFVSCVFFLLTPLDFVTSLLSMAPGGAPQMSSSAAVLNLDASIVAAIQLVRLLIIFLLIPAVIPYVMKKYGAAQQS